MNADPQNTQTQYYSFPLLLAISLHIIVIAFLMFELSFPVKSSPGASSSQPVIQATAVSQQTLDNYENQVQAAREAEIKQQQLQQQIAREKIIRQQELVKQQQLQQLQAQRQLELQKRQAEEMAKQKVIAAAEKAAAQKAAVEKTQKRAAQKAEKKLLQKALAQDMQKELASDQHELNQSNQHAAASSASKASPSPSSAPQNQGMIDKYKALIVQAISSQWIVPSNLPQNISCELDIRVAPGGAVLDVSVARSSGNPVLDNSAVAAVNKASPLPVPTEPGVFNQFRELHLTVRPDGSMSEV
jgi:colicin import membrane protein